MGQNSCQPEGGIKDIIDVAVAARSAALTRGAAGALDLAAAEPWPPMRVRDSK